MREFYRRTAADAVSLFVLSRSGIVFLFFLVGAGSLMAAAARKLVKG